MKNNRAIFIGLLYYCSMVLLGCQGIISMCGRQDERTYREYLLFLIVTKN